MMLPYSYAEIVRHLEAGLDVTFVAFVGGRGKMTINANVSWETQRRLDNFPRGFDSERQALTYYPQCLNVLDVDRNQWITIKWSNIIEIKL